ncbi:MAG: DUF4238 domain-containing protein [Lachnospiraceae bacterium]|nr:DUF4238 domain-containing protein [Lachnospiraceae bacterium]
MLNDSEYTKWEHFVPRVYLKGFSEIKKKKSKEKSLLWAYNVRAMQQINCQVDIEDFCAEDNLYELRDEEGKFIARNIIEKVFSRIEAQVGAVIEKIKTKSQNEKCMVCPCILSEEDKSILIILMTMILFRDPKTINLGMKFLKQENPDMDERASRNFTLLNLLPLGIIPEWDENTIIREAVTKYSGMEVQIGIASDDVIITSDRPVIEWPPKDTELFNRPRAVAFPLTSKLVLYLFPIETDQQIGRSFFFELSDEQIKDIQTNVAVCARKWIFSRNALTEEQMERIKEGRSRWENSSLNILDMGRPKVEKGNEEIE